MKKVQEYLDSNRVHEIPTLIEEYNIIIKNRNLKESLSDIPTNLTIQMELMKEFNDQRFSIAISPNSKSYAKCVAEFLANKKSLPLPYILFLSRPQGSKFCQIYN